MSRIFFLMVLVGGCFSNQNFESKNLEAKPATGNTSQPSSEDAIREQAEGETENVDPEPVPAVNTDNGEEEISDVDEGMSDKDPVVTTPGEDNMGDSSGEQTFTELTGLEISEMQEFIEGWCPFDTDYFVGEGDPKGKESVNKDDYAWLEKIPGGGEYERVVTFEFGNTRNNPTCMADVIVDSLAVANLQRLVGTDKEIACDVWATYDSHNNRLERRFDIDDMSEAYGSSSWSASCHDTVGIVFTGKSDGSMEVIVLEHTDEYGYEVITRFYNSKGKRFKKT